jgi:hypothetical protein
MAKIAFFGGTGGLGSKVIEHLGRHTIKPVGSRLVNLQEESEIQNYFSNNKDLDVLVIFSNYNFNAFLHKYKENQKELNKQIAINIEGVTTCIANVLPNMRERNFGRIILASSITVDRNVIGTSLYAASYLVYFGDVTNEVGTPMAIGATVKHTYATSGNYNVKVVALSGGAAKTEKTNAIVVTDPFGLPLDFENAFVNYFFGTFGGGQGFATVANPSATGLNTSAKVGKFTRGWEGWSGTYSPMGAPNNPIDFSVGKIIKVLVYNPDAALIGAKLNVELEWAIGGKPSNGVAVLKVPVTTSGAWEELVFDFSGIAAIPDGTKFTQLVLRFNDSVDGAGAVIYVDNFRLTK